MFNKSEIEKIYESVICEHDTTLIDSQEYQSIRGRCNSKEDRLKELIGKEKFRKFEEFMEDYCELSELENEYYFTKGFSVANKLRDEALMK